MSKWLVEMRGLETLVRGVVEVLRLCLRRVALTITVSVFGLGLCLSAGAAEAVALGAPSPWWSLSQSMAPSVVVPGHQGKLVVRALDVGDGSILGLGNPVVLSDVLPADLKPVGISGVVRGWFINAEGKSDIDVHGSVNCTLATLSCTYAEDASPFNVIEVTIVFTAESEAVSGANSFSVRGGGAPGASRSQQITVSEGPVVFGVEGESYGLSAEEEGGLPAVQAGGHPFQLTTSFVLNNTGSGTLQPAQPRNQIFRLPAGLVGDAQATPQCTVALFDTLTSNGDGCPADTAIGVAVVWLSGQVGAAGAEVDDAVPVFNLVPGFGEPARFGIFPGAPVVIDTSLRSGGDYGVVASVHNITEGIAELASTVTLWGDPGSHAHDSMRGWQCLKLTSECPNAEQPQLSLLRMPTACEEALRSPMLINSWSDSGFLGPIESSLPLSSEGCNHEQFAPSIGVASSTSEADSPTGLDVHVRVPQQAGEQPENVGQADVRNTTVLLPAGLQVNPAAASGLAACSMSEIGFIGLEEGTGRPLFREETEAERLSETPYQAQCPAASRIGEVTVHTKLLPEALTGYVYQAAQGTGNPFGSLLALYIIAEDPKVGVRARLAGEVKIQPDGQLISSFKQLPQVPFEEFSIQFFGGSNAPLATTSCGIYTTRSIMEPWSSGTPGEILAQPETSFQIQNAPGGGPCPSTRPFAPDIQTGVINNVAGTFSPMSVQISRDDVEQTLGAVSITEPPGLAGMISNVTPCPEPAASTGQCSPASQIGHVQISAGVGRDPLTLPQPGKPQDPVYLTGPYDGAPFGIAIVAPAEAGPFNLDENGHPVVVRGTINVNPHTAQVTINTNPPPERLQGIPLDLQDIQVMIDKPAFIYNPTSCKTMSITGTASSTEGATETFVRPFQAVSCGELPFHPTFKLATNAKHTRRFGAYLHANLTSSQGQANIKSLYVELPKILPSRQSTFKEACSTAQFTKNPAGCPAASMVGTVVVHTPVLPVPLAGPAILVSHGGAGFPNLTLILQGDGITIEQEGETNIVKGVTSSAFKSVPDTPFSSIEVTLPTGPHSLLTATANLCAKTVTKRVRTRFHGHVVFRKRRMIVRRSVVVPTTITGQNGSVIKQSTPIAVQGCGKGQ